MPKYDAFGREIGEDTLAGLGGSDSSPAATPPPPAFEPAPRPSFETPPPSGASAPPQPTFSIPDAPAPVPRVRRRGVGGFGCFFALVFAALFVAGPIIAVVSFVGSADDAIDDVTAIVEGVPGAPGSPEEPAPPPTGVDGRSMIAPGNLADALARLRGERVARVSYIRLEAARLDTTSVKGSRQRSFQIRHDGEMTATPPAAGGSSTSIPLRAVDPRAPARLVRASAERYGYKADRINYLVASPSIDGGPRWIAYFRNGHYIEGDARGRIVRRIS